MTKYPTPREAFPTDVTSPTPTQQSGPKPGPRKAQVETPAERPRRDPPPSQEEDDSE
jgi:hypothetical protein